MVVLDTSVVSIIFRGDTIAPYYERIIEGNSALISFQTLQEVWSGIPNLRVISAHSR